MLRSNNEFYFFRIVHERTYVTAYIFTTTVDNSGYL